jgi:hypothetical protein
MQRSYRLEAAYEADQKHSSNLKKWEQEAENLWNEHLQKETGCIF